jgi:hypothetical protein
MAASHSIDVDPRRLVPTMPNVRWFGDLPSVGAWLEEADSA